MIRTKLLDGQLITFGEKIVRRSDQKLIAEYKTMFSMGGWTTPALLLADERGMVAGCAYEGRKVLSHDSFFREEEKNGSKFDKLISQTFTKE